MELDQPFSSFSVGLLMWFERIVRASVEQALLHPSPLLSSNSTDAMTLKQSPEATQARR